jgi:hypothetical protein
MTKADTSKKWALSSQQEAALDLLAAGQNITDTAAALDLARQTVSEWLNHHAGFQAALNQRRQDLWAGCADRLRALLPQALDTLEKALGSYEHRLKAAEIVLKAAGFFGNSQQPAGPTNAEVIEQTRAIVEKERADALFLRDLSVTMK